MRSIIISVFLCSLVIAEVSEKFDLEDLLKVLSKFDGNPHHAEENNMRNRGYYELDNDPVGEDARLKELARKYSPATIRRTMQFVEHVMKSRNLMPSKESKFVF